MKDKLRIIRYELSDILIGVNDVSTHEELSEIIMRIRHLESVV